MKFIVVLAVAFIVPAFGQTAWEKEMTAGIAALGPTTAEEAKQHFRAAVAAASTPVEKASALTRLGLVLHGLVKSPSDEYLISTVEPLYVEAISIDSQDSTDHALALELYSLLLRGTGWTDEAERQWASAAAIRKTLAARAVEDPPPADVKRIGPGISAPLVVFKTEPAYTEEARIMKYQGSAVLNVVVGADGQIHNPRIVRGVGLGLDEQAVQAVRKWKFEPASMDGRPVNVSARIEVNFRLL